MAFSPEVLNKYPSIRKFMEDDDYPEWNDGREQALLKYIKQHPNFSTFKKNPSKLLAAMDDFANHHEFLINVGSDKGRIVCDIIAEQRPRVLVELGGYVGYSAIMFADAMRRCVSANMTTEAADASSSSSSSPVIKFWSLESEPAFAEIARELVAIAGLEDVVTVVTGMAGESIRGMKADGRLEDGIDMLFIDHSEGGVELYEIDLRICEELGLLKSGACIVADNVLRPGAPRYREYVRGHKGWKSKGVKGLIMPGEFEDELEVTKVL